MWRNGVIAHNTATGAVLWSKEQLLGIVYTLRIHGGVVVIPVDYFKTVVLDLTTGRQLYTLPSAGVDARGLCVFDGLISEISCCADLFTSCYYVSAANESSLEGG